MGSPLQSVSDAGVPGPLTRFDPYGGLRAGSATPGPLGFTGEWSDATGLVDLRARAYDPSFGRFLSQDTFGGFAALPASGNRYAYAHGNPLRFVDPSGHTVREVLNTIAENPGELASLSLAFASGKLWGAYMIASAIRGEDLLTGERLSFEERLVYVGFGAFAIATSLRAPATGGRGVLGLWRSLRAEFGALGSRLFGRTALGGLRFGTALARTRAVGLSVSTWRVAATVLRQPGAGIASSFNRISLREAEAAAVRAGIDMRMIELRYSAGWEAFGYISQKGTGEILRGETGQFIVVLQDLALISTREAVATIAHELNHLRGILKSGMPSAEGVAEAAAQLAARYFR